MRQHKRCTTPAATGFEILDLALASLSGSRVRFRFSRPHLEEKRRGRNLKFSGLNWVAERLRLNACDSN
jgi:hypothetical protein